MLQQKSQIVPLLRLEEGVKYTPYLDSLGYPTVGVGFKLGPQGASIKNYTFTLGDDTINTILLMFSRKCMKKVIFQLRCRTATSRVKIF